MRDIITEVVLGIVIFVSNPQHRLVPENHTVIQKVEFKSTALCNMYVDGLVSNIADQSGVLDVDDNGKAFSERVLVATCIVAPVGTTVLKDEDRFVLALPTGVYRRLQPLLLN